MVASSAKPFLKWAGGKTQLLEEFKKRIPPGLKEGKFPVFVEPFVGGGAVFFYFNGVFRFKECHIYDSNEELILTYNVVKKNVEELIDHIGTISQEYFSKNESGKKQYFYQVRDEFNHAKPSIDFHNFERKWVERAAQLIFLNKTCFNGLFRVNFRGAFNVPFGRYKNPKILNEDLLRVDSEILQNTTIHLGDFEDSYSKISNKSFVYFDPPYRPLNATSSFTQYSKGGFGDTDQKRLAEFFAKCDKKQAKLLLSNSDPKNSNPDDDFFDILYRDYHVDRVQAKRIINCDGTKRGDVREIIVTNY